MTFRLAPSSECRAVSLFESAVTAQCRLTRPSGQFPWSSAVATPSLRQSTPRYQWLNADGFKDVPIAGSTLSRYALDRENPLTLFDAESGDKFRIGFETITTDGGSIPRVIQIIPGFEARRFMRAYPLHDGTYQRGYIYICYRNDPFVWYKVQITQAFADELLRWGILAEGQLVLDANPQWSKLRRSIYKRRITAISNTVYVGLRVGGFVAWNHYRRQGKKVAPNG